jgi:hypothetical protein
MMEHFLQSSDPHFFDDIRNRIAFAVADIKNKRRDQSIAEKRKSLVAEEEEEEETL